MNLPPGVTKDDLCYCSMGLIDAVKKFDVSKGVQFKHIQFRGFEEQYWTNLDDIRLAKLYVERLGKSSRQRKLLKLEKNGSASDDELAMRWVFQRKIA